jgi:hypothetical protein
MKDITLQIEVSRLFSKAMSLAAHSSMCCPIPAIAG